MEKEKLVALPASAAKDQQLDSTHIAKEEREASSSCLLVSRGAPDIYLPNRAFYFPGLVGTELLEGRRMEDCGCTLGIKINLIFVEKTTCLQPWRNVIGTFWLRKIYWFVCQLACCCTFPKVMQFGF